MEYEISYSYRMLLCSWIIKCTFPQACGSSRNLISGRHVLLILPVAGCWPNDLMSAAVTRLTHYINIKSIAHAALYTVYVKRVCIGICSTEHSPQKGQKNKIKKRCKCVKLKGMFTECDYQFDYCFWTSKIAQLITHTCEVLFIVSKQFCTQKKKPRFLEKL